MTGFLQKQTLASLRLLGKEPIKKEFQARPKTPLSCVSMNDYNTPSDAC